MNDNILPVAGQLCAHLYPFNRSITWNTLATGNSSGKYSPLLFYNMQAGLKGITQIDQNRAK